MPCTKCMYVHQEPLCACAPSSTLRMGSKVPSLRGSKASPCPSMEKECKPHNKKFLCTPKFNLHVKHNVHVCASTSTLCISRCVLLTSHQVYVKFLSKMVLVVMNCAWLTTSFHVHRLHGKHHCWPSSGPILAKLLPTPRQSVCPDAFYLLPTKCRSNS